MVNGDMNDAPATADEIDVDRVIWDPAYREAAITVLARDNDRGQGSNHDDR